MLSPATWLREDKGFRSVDSERLNFKASSRYPATSPASARMVSAPLHESSGEIKDASWNDDLFHHVRGERLQRLVSSQISKKNKMNTNSSKFWKIQNKNTQKKTTLPRKGQKYHTLWCLDSWKPPQFFLPNLLASHAHAPPHLHVGSPLFVAARGHNLGTKTKTSRKNTKSVYITCSHTHGKLYILYDI